MLLNRVYMLPKRHNWVVTLAGKMSTKLFFLSTKSPFCWKLSTNFRKMSTKPCFFVHKNSLVLYAVLGVFLCFCSRGHAQERLELKDLIVECAVLETSLRRHFIDLAEALIEEFSYKEKGKVLRYLPSLGYNFITNSPHIAYSSSALYAAINDRHIKRAKIRSIRKAMQNSFQAEIKKLRKHYANLEADIEYYNQAIQLYQINQVIFSIRQQQYQNLEIVPLEFLRSQLRIKEEEMRLRKKYHAILKCRNHILEIAQVGPQPQLYQDL